MIDKPLKDFGKYPKVLNFLFVTLAKIDHLGYNFNKS